MKMKQLQVIAAAALLLMSSTASAHISYGSGATGRDFGTVVPGGAPVTISNQTVTSNYGWADGTDADHGDSHKLRYYRFKVVTPGFVTLTFSGSTNGGTRDGSIKPAFSLYRGLAHLPPITTAPGSADYDTSAITTAYRATLGYPTEGSFHALKTWRIGGDNQTGPIFDFDAPDGLSTFTYVTHIADGDATLFGSAPGIVGDGNADGTVTKSLFLTAGDYTITVGGANYAGQSPTPDETVYGLVGTVSATPFAYAVGDPAAGGIGYAHQLTLEPKSSGSFSSHVGAWSWEDNSLFGGEGQGTAPVGWTHTSNWLALRVQQDMNVTITMSRDAEVPWNAPSAPPELNGKADTASMFPSFTLWKNWDNDGEDTHTYNNRGNVDWAEDLVYKDHVDNSTEETITRTYFLRAGDYTMALGSNAPANNTNRQGYKISFATTPVNLEDPGEGGIGYQYTVIAGAGVTGSFSSHVGAWSWEDNELFGNPNQSSQPVGWTHTSNWVAVKLTQEVFFTLTLERDANVNWGSAPEELNGKADTSSMFPSFTLWRGWDNDVAPQSFRTRPDIVEAWSEYGGVPANLGDHHTYNNRGNVDWAEDLRYIDHVDNSTKTKVTRTWRLPAGEYSFAIGSNASSQNPWRQGYKASFSTLAATSVINGDLASGGIGYSHIVSVRRGDSGHIVNHVGSWSWEDSRLFNAALGQPPVGWTHQSTWLGMHVRDHITLNITMSRDAAVAWPSPELPDRKAAVDQMFPSFTLWRGWDNDGGDHHTYNNRGNVGWAEDISYIDHFDNTRAPSITRSYTLAPGYYTFALGSNSEASEVATNRQGFRFEWSTESPALTAPIITQNPKNAVVVVGKKVSLSVKAGGPGLSYEWRNNGRTIQGANAATLNISRATLIDSGSYICIARNAAGWATSSTATVTVLDRPVVNPFNIPDLTIGQFFETTVTATHRPASFSIIGLPKGFVYDKKSGRISGRAMEIKNNITVEVTATNAAGTSAKATDTYSVLPLPLGYSGTFTAPLARSAPMNALLGGVLRLEVSSLGSFSAALTLGKAGVLRVSSPLDTTQTNPSGTLTLPRRGLPTLTLTFTLRPAENIITGSLMDGTNVLPYIARRHASTAGAYAGNFTSALLLSGDDVGIPSIPQGYGGAAFKIESTGVTRGVISLADHTKITFASALDQQGFICLHSLIYAKAGSVLGLLAPDSATGDLSGSEISWFKGRVAKDLSYRDGFGPLALDMNGRRYALPEAARLPLNAQAGAGNARITFAEGNAPSPETRLNTSSLQIKATEVGITAPNPGVVKLSIKDRTGSSFTPGETGTFKGSFELTDTDTSVRPNKPLKRTADFYGIIVDDGTGLKGYGYFVLPIMPTASPRTTLKTAPRFSGSVLLETVPVITE